MKNNSFEFNNIKSNNAEQLKPKTYYSANFIGKNQNKISTQKPSAGVENIVEKTIDEKTETERLKEKQTKSQEVKTKSAAVSRILTTFVAAVSSVVIGVTNISGILPEPTTLVAQIEYTEATNHEIYYNVIVEDSRNKRSEDYKDVPIEETYYDEEPTYYEIDLTDLYVVLYNDFTNRTEEIREQFWSGCFENLQKNMLYTLEVRYKNNVLASETVRTTNEPETEPEEYDPEDDPEQDPEEEPITSDDPDEDPNLSDDPTGRDDPEYDPDDPEYEDPEYEPDDPDNPEYEDPEYDPDDPDNPDYYDPDDPDNPEYYDPDDPDNPEYVEPDDPDNPDNGNQTGGDQTGGDNGFTTGGN